MYPVMLNVREQRCLVVGGGGVALRKIEGLLGEGASVTVIALEPIQPVQELVRRGKITLEKRRYRQGDLTSFVLAFATTSDPGVNQQVADEARKLGIWVNVADEPEQCTFHLPARVKRGALQLLVASGGDAPFVVRRLRRLLEKTFGPEWAEWLESAKRFRWAVRDQNLSVDQKQNRFDRFFSGTVDEERLVVRVPSQEEEDLWLKDPCETVSRPARSSAELARKDRRQLGLVSLVGAGPGDSGLLTVRGRQRLLAADAVVYDHLAETVIPCELSENVELHPVGKKAGYHPVGQPEINALLIRLAREGKRVVRLKGGDPYVFGRGGEEAEALFEAKIPFEVVPCVTAATAVPAYAGIPVTHRKEVVHLGLVTAHETVKEGGPQVRWDLLAKDRHSTLVGYMGVTSLPRVTRSLIESGMDGETPSAMIERGTTSQQRVVRAPLKALHQEARKANIQPPALFVIGPCVNHSDRLDWFTIRPLLGERLVIPSPGIPAADTLELNGVEIVEVPLPISPASRIVVEALPVTGCVFQSRHALDALEGERDLRSWGSKVIAWCLGPETAARARQLGWTLIEELPQEASGWHLVDALLTRLRPTGEQPTKQGGR